MKNHITILVYITLIGFVSNASPGVVYSGGDGRSLENAVVITGSDNHSEVILSEYVWIEQEFGVENIYWKRLWQSFDCEYEKAVDTICIEFIEPVGDFDAGDQIELYFDITEITKAELSEIFSDF
jgi:hypothetical protein